MFERLFCFVNDKQAKEEIIALETFVKSYTIKMTFYVQKVNYRTTSLKAKQNKYKRNGLSYDINQKS